MKLPRLFPSSFITKTLNITPHALKYLRYAKVITPQKIHNTKYAYTFNDIKILFLIRSLRPIFSLQQLRPLVSHLSGAIKHLAFKDLRTSAFIIIKPSQVDMQCMLVTGKYAYSDDLPLINVYLSHLADKIDSSYA